MNKNKTNNVLAGFILLTDANMDWPRVRHNLKEDWGISVADEVKDGAIMFQVDGMNVVCSLLPSPIPNNEAEENAKSSFLWKNAAQEVAKHRAHVMIAVMNKEDSIEQSLLFVKVCSSMLKLKNTIGVYKNPTVYEKDFYVNVSKLVKDDMLPIPLMLHIGMFITKDSLLCGYTYGLRSFGKEEIEVIDTLAQPADLYNFMLSISEYVLTTDVELKDGETIGFTEDEKLPIALSKGISVEGDTIKIGYKCCSPQD